MLLLTDCDFLSLFFFVSEANNNRFLSDERSLVWWYAIVRLWNRLGRRPQCTGSHDERCIEDCDSQLLQLQKTIIPSLFNTFIAFFCLICCWDSTILWRKVYEFFLDNVLFNS